MPSSSSSESLLFSNREQWTGLSLGSVEADYNVVCRGRENLSHCLKHTSPGRLPYILV